MSEQGNVVTDLAARVRARFTRSKTAEMRAAYRRVFDTEDGRVVLADLLKFSGVGRESFVPGQPDATAFGLGMQRLALRITGFLDMTDRHLLKIANLEGDDDGEI